MRLCLRGPVKRVKGVKSHREMLNDGIAEKLDGFVVSIHLPSVLCWPSTNAISLLTDLNQYLRNPRNRILNLNRLAAYHFRNQDYDTAAGQMQEALALDRSDSVTAINLAAVLMTLGRLDEALGHLLEIYPASLDRPQLSFSVHFNVACVYSMKKNTEKALQNLALATQIDPASTMASLGDPQLDFIRADGRFRELSQAVENFVLQNQQ